MDEARALALEMARAADPTPENIRRIALATSSEAASWAFTQWQLRRVGLRKFALANEMLFVREALEQATGEILAAYHASRFVAAGWGRGDGEDSAGCKPPASYLEVADLTCGIGGDLIALARIGRATGFELDPERADCARHNLSVHGVSAEVRVESCLDHLAEFKFAFADPARRVGGRRSTDIADFQPDPMQIAEAMREMELGGIKLSPLLPDSVLAGFGGRVEFVSYGGECREALVWLGKRAGEPGTYAVWTDGSRVETLPSTDPPSRVEEAMGMVAEADPAAIRAHALGGFACWGLGDSNGYLTADDIAPSVWLRRFEVLFDGPWRPKTIQDELRRLNAKVTAVKARAKGAEVDEAAKKLKGAGPRSVVLMLYPVGPKVRAALAVPLD